MADQDLLAEAREAFKDACEAEDDNRRDALADLRFARLGEQWPAQIVQQREREGRPCLTINRMPSFIRQVVNDSRQNKPSIKVHPADSKADPETADIYNGLIRNIQYVSDADVAYDTAIESAVSGGFGYFRLGLDYAHDDTFDLDISIDRIADPFLIYGDPGSTAADSSDWTTAFVIDIMRKADFERQYKGAQAVDWDGDGYGELGEPWYRDNAVMRAEWWRREEVLRPIVLLSDGSVVEEAVFAAQAELFALQGVTPVTERAAKSWRVTQTILTGAEVLEENAWPGKFIPIVPVYGDEVVIEGKRHLRSLIRDAKDPQRMFNFWRTASTELVALAPKTPWIGPKGAFKTDAPKWSTANTQSHQYIEYDGQVPPQRQPFAGPPGGALQEALNASDDMKAAVGLYDASLGARSNEVSGRAILARQREGDVGTFHFIDNMARAIRHAGRILIDLIPKVYNKRRVIRVLGEDGTPAQKPLGQPVPVMDQNGQPVVDQFGQAVTRIYDLSAGKYDLTVTTGPSFTTRREEAAAQMMELIRSFPQAAPLIGDIVAKNLDWAGADEIARRLQTLLPGQGQGGLPPKVQQMIQQGQALIAELKAQNQKLATENRALRADKSIGLAKTQVSAHKAQTDAFKAQTDRLAVLQEIAQQPASVPQTGTVPGPQAAMPARTP